MTNKIFIFDTTLRDGAQGENISFSVKDKLHIIEKFNDIGIDYIEVGFPASNPKDIEIFEILKKRKFTNSKIVAFGRTKYKNTTVKDDDNIRTLIACAADVICIFGKSSTLHAEKVIEKLEPLFFGFVQEAYKVLKPEGRLVLVTPFMRTRSGQAVTMPIAEKALETGFSVVKPFVKENFKQTHVGKEDLSALESLVEIDERHKTGREIHVFRK